MKNYSALLAIGLISTFCFFYTTTTSANNSANFTAAPPFVATEVGKPNVVIALDISGSMKVPAYSDTNAIANGGNWRQVTHNDFNPNYSYFGYFENDQNYSYAPESNRQFFYADSAGLWNGNYLNWLSMRRMDVVRKVLVGGKIKNRNGEFINGKNWYVLEGQNEPLDYTFKKKYEKSNELSPIANNAEVVVSEGAFTVTSGNGASILPIN